ncbi:MAG TPA: histidine kinase dimerization/phospho-acceptor domain-containing protein, partial [Candidatus Saccharimonas sp.]|nr:histidine kinase dimerization/phospho-acceptor domain-containing protein [Candidatus Saccharimonas sp.]
FPHILATESNAVAIYLMIGTASRYYPNIGLAEFTPPDFDVTTQEFYYIADPQHDPDKTTKWTTVYDDPAGNGLVTTASRPIYLDNGTLAGIVGTDVTLNNIAHNLEDYSPIDSSYAFLIDNQGRAIALPDQGYHDLLGRTPKKGEFGVNLQSVKGDFGDILSRMRAGKNGFTQATAAGTQLLVAYAAVPGTSFSVGIVARQSTVLSVITDLQNDVTTSTERVLLYQVLPASILILGLVWVFGFIYIRRLTAPIKHLTAQTARVAGGDFEIEPTSSGLDNEIDQLASAFGGMVADLRSSRHKIEEQTQELLHNEQTRLKASINSLNVGFIMTGTENEVILLNGVAQQILAYDDPAAPNSVPAHQGSWTTDAIDGQLGTSIAFKANLGRVLAAGSSFEQNEVDFRGHILRIFMAPILEDKQSLGAVVLIEDITAVKALERSKDEFFSIASHELRTPLTAVRGNAALIQQLYSPKVKDKDFDEMVTDIHDASVRLIDIVNDFLDASRLEQGRIQFENTTFPISEVLDAVSYELAAVAKERGNQITIQPSTKNVPPVFADKNRVKQIVYNLVGNAMKFTDRGTITLGAVVDGQLLRTTVTDNGPGIPEEGQRMLFRKFQQGNTMLTR